MKACVAVIALMVKRTIIITFPGRPGGEARRDAEVKRSRSQTPSGTRHFGVT
jgi:hypothetical protein